jgi:hypothetical protein
MAADAEEPTLCVAVEVEAAAAIIQYSWLLPLRSVYFSFWGGIDMPDPFLIYDFAPAPPVPACTSCVAFPTPQAIFSYVSLGQPIPIEIFIIGIIIIMIAMEQI